MYAFKMRWTSKKATLFLSFSLNSSSKSKIQHIKFQTSRLRILSKWRIYILLWTSAVVNHPFPDLPTFLCLSGASSIYPSVFAPSDFFFTSSVSFSLILSRFISSFDSFSLLFPSPFPFIPPFSFFSAVLGFLHLCHLNCPPLFQIIVLFPCIFVLLNPYSPSDHSLLSTPVLTSNIDDELPRSSLI